MTDKGFCRRAGEEIGGPGHTCRLGASSACLSLPLSTCCAAAEPRPFCCSGTFRLHGGCSVDVSTGSLPAGLWLTEGGAGQSIFRVLVGHLGVSQSSWSSLELDCLHKKRCNFFDVILANISSVGFFTLLSSQHTKIPNSGPRGPFTQRAISQALKAGLTLSQALKAGLTLSQAASTLQWSSWPAPGPGSAG